ncbi:cadherin domain-containing protein [Spongiimicrobium salis]|uniref:cadherin domain-containing protein n=1 Tax=Spongiimicrobium salis TaxID=1667022 RepID=UPI00374D2996
MRKQIKLILALTLLTFFNCGKDDDGPDNTAPVIGAQTFNASETVTDSDVFGNIVATDPDGDDLTFSIQTNDNDLFEVTAAGALSLAQGRSLDFENTTSHTITVNVTDGEANTTANMTINVVDVDENTPPIIADQTFDFPENASSGEFFAIASSDDEGDALTYAITTNSAGIFRINNDGEVSTTTGPHPTLNFEVMPTHTIVVEVSDGMLTSSARIIINLTDQNDLPTVPDTNTTFTVAEDIADTEVIGNLNATDEDGDNLTYDLDTSNNTSAVLSLFEIDENTGDISLVSGQSLDFETTTSYTVFFDIFDGQASLITSVVINVTDVVESQIFTTTTMGGQGSTGRIDGGPMVSAFNLPSGLAIADNGDLYIADSGNGDIRVVDANLNTTTFFRNSGNRDPLLSIPQDAVFDSNGNLFAVDQRYNVVVKFDTSGNGTIFAGGSDGNTDGTGTAAQFTDPVGIAIDGQDNLYVADRGNRSVRKITPSGEVTTLISDPNSGGGVNPPALPASLASITDFFPDDVVLDTDGNIYVISGNRKIFKITASGTVSTFAGSDTRGDADGIGTAASFSTIFYLDIDAQNNLYTADGAGSNKIKKITPNAEVSTLVGDGRSDDIDGSGGPEASSFNNPRGIAVNADGSILFVSSHRRHVIRKIEINNNNIGGGLN